MKLTIQNLGITPFVFKDPQGYSPFVGEVAPLTTTAFEVSPDVVYRLGPSLQEAVAHPVPAPNLTDYFLKIAYSALSSAQDMFEFSCLAINRPQANTVPAGTCVFVTDEGANGAPQWSNGTVWVDADGNLS